MPDAGLLDPRCRRSTVRHVGNAWVFGWFSAGASFRRSRLRKENSRPLVTPADVSGHKGGIAGIYNRAVYAPEKAQALALWADHVSALVEGRESNVTPLKWA
jgi:hypothetical protein